MNQNIIPEDHLIVLLWKENDIRKSELTQRLFEESEKSEKTEWMQGK